MCCFTGPVEAVGATRIFARGTEGGRQLLVYQMEVSAPSEVAMVLPLPIDRQAPEPLRFLHRPDADDLMASLAAAFARNEVQLRLGLTKSGRSVSEPLPVVEIGAYVASYVPDVGRFSDLDPRFRLAPDLLSRQPDWAGYGFAVFALKPGRRAVRPMVLDFARSEPRTLFFPTVHVHDGERRREARFDHELFLQPQRRERLDLSGWEESQGPASRTVRAENVASGLVIGDAHVYRRAMDGILPNDDVRVPSRR